MASREKSASCEKQWPAGDWDWRWRAQELCLYFRTARVQQPAAAPSSRRPNHALWTVLLFGILAVIVIVSVKAQHGGWLAGETVTTVFFLSGFGPMYRENVA